MDILSATTNARPQYGVIIYPESGLPLPVKAHTQLEIGFGNGEFTVQYAEANPEILLYGVEISQSCVLRCARRSAGLYNLRLINTDARYMLRELFADETLEKIIMQFPCPWSSNKQAHRRVTAKDFSDGLAAVLKVGGVFEMVSDDETYSREVKDVLGKHEALELTEFTINPDRAITTKYERKWLSEGKNIFRVCFRKHKAFTISRRTSQDMHIKIKNHVTESQIAAFKNLTGKDATGKSFWKFGRYFINPEKNNYLLDTLTSDEEFEQKFYINILPRDEGFLIRLDKTTEAFLTPAVRAALNDVADKLAHDQGRTTNN